MSHLADRLSRAAALWGLEPGYWDIWGGWHETTPEVRGAVLRALGVPVDDAERLEAAIEQRERGAGSRVAPPVVVVTAGDAAIPLHLPEELAGGQATVEFRWEDGRFEQHEYALTGSLPLPPSAPLGYHEVEIRVPSLEPVVTRLVVCPERAWMPPTLERGERRAGLAVSLYGVHSDRTWGFGDFTALGGVIDWVADQIGGSFVALNPLNAIHNRRPYNTSPYLPNSGFYRNFLYLDIEAIEEFAECPPAQALRRRPEVEAEIAAVQRSEFIEYERVAALKRRFLRLMFRHFQREVLAGDSARASEFRHYAAEEGEPLERFAIYSALDEWLHRRDPDVWIWPQWPEKFQDPCSGATRQFALAHHSAVLYHQYVQWQIDRQLARAQQYARARGLEIGLFHDLPLATDRCGSELWAHRDFYVAGCRVGAPPDDFSPKGQDWSFPPPNRERHYEDGYRLFAASIREAARHGGALRIDHVMRLFRLYWIPDGSDATQGVYVRDRAEDLLRILALESVRQQVLIIGEDLGTVDPAVREMLARYGILSYRLFYFERNGQGEFRPPGEYPRQALVSSTTHDLPTLAGFWLGSDIVARRDAGLLPDEATYHRMWYERAGQKQKMLDALFRLGLLPDSFPRNAADLPELTGELHNAITGFLVSTPSLLLTLNQEDLTKETEQQNLPGSVHQYPNWRRKMRFSVEELHESATARDFAVMFRHWLEREGRMAGG